MAHKESALQLVVNKFADAAHLLINLGKTELRLFQLARYLQPVAPQFPLREQH